MTLDIGGLAISTIGTTGSIYGYISKVHFPDALSKGLSFGSGNNYTLTPEYKRIAAFNGDYSFQAPRRHFLEVASRTQPAWAYWAYHGSDLTEFFSFGGSASGNDFIGTDALVNFATNLDPNYSPNTTDRGISLLETTLMVRMDISATKYGAFPPIPLHC
ncbi:hypothetical protein EV421DRAFT_2027133 [Armillaria borealis]|uniref:Uncharacterized protein n=1 Tax=Armillaria borealis TaxID=47425 RepID=A0AA39M5L6_9AGAR|nr:hypothetical protein EV421DRAFT_2027133 [Armillaria borealis]